MPLPAKPQIALYMRQSRAQGPYGHCQGAFFFVRLECRFSAPACRAEIAPRAMAVNTGRQATA
jgi:hypothetical protein